MAARVGVFAGVLLRRRIAAERDITGLAGPQMNPSRTDLDALEALETLRLFDALDGDEVRAWFRRHL